VSIPAQAQRENRSIGENGREARRAAKQQQKYAKKTSKKQRKAMKKYQKAQKKATKNRNAVKDSLPVLQAIHFNVAYTS